MLESEEIVNEYKVEDSKYKNEMPKEALTGDSKIYQNGMKIESEEVKNKSTFVSFLTELFLRIKSFFSKNK